MAINVLIVDDSPAMRRIIARTLRLSGMEVGNYLEAGSGRAALDILRANTVGLVLADINMPEMNGEELIAEMSRDKLLSSIPVIMVSTDGTRKRVDRLQQLGAKGYIQKPFRPESLRVEAERVLGGRA